MTDEPGNDGTSANSGISATLFTQEQMNHVAAEAKRGAVGGFFKDLGLDKAPSGEELKEALGHAVEYRKLKDGEKGDVERLNGQLTDVTKKAEKVPALEAQLHRAQLAGDAGLKPRYWKYVEGDTDEAIQASIKEVLADIKGGGEGESEGEGATGATGPGQQQGSTGSTGSGLTPNQQQGTGAGGKPPVKSMSAGAEAYNARHKKKE